MIRNWIPRWMRIPLWGDRERWGLNIDHSDADWEAYQETITRFYDETQRDAVGSLVSNGGYRVMSRIDLTGKTVLEVGPGDMRHIPYWKGQPAEYVLADIQTRMLEMAQEKLAQSAIPYSSLLLNRGEPLPLDSASVDVIVSFYSLEHIHPLAPYLKELDRVLKPGGTFMGAIPAEGGLAWGLGRFLTSRRWFKRKTKIDPDKIICWEHPNFGDNVLYALDEQFERERVGFWPLPFLPLLDVNLVIRFIYKKPG